AYLAVRTLDPVVAADELDVRDRSLEMLGGEAQAVLRDLLRGPVHGAAQAVQRARAAGRVGDEVVLGLRGAQADAFDRDAEHGGDDLRERRLVALAVVVRGGAQRDAAVLL